MRPLARPLALLAVIVALLSGHAAQAGTASLAWDPVADSDLAGYRVYFGTSPTSYSNSVDVGNVTTTTISGLTDCTNFYFGVKAYDTAGNESTTYSNQIQGWARPIVSSVTPSAAEQGRSLTLTIAGSNFQSGASASFAASGITVTSTTVNACGQLTLNVTISGTAATGATNLDVTNADGVFGTGAALFTVQTASVPTVASTTPSDGATGVSISVHPTVTFSEPMQAASITSATVRLLNDTGAAVAQAGGSPSLSGNGLTATITPAANLTQGQTYRIQVIGGAAGVRDLGGLTMAATMTQSTGFSTDGDVTAPTISAVAATGIGGTTATITWTTSESADSQVFYRKQGTTTYLQTALNTTLVTSHSVALAGLAPSTTYDYYVTSADSGGNTATSTPTGTFTTASNGFTYLRFEAEAGTLVTPMRAVTGAAGSFSTAYIDTPSGTPTGSASSPAGTATFGANIPTAGSWKLWVRMYGPSSSTNSFFETVNGATRAQITTSSNGQWEWVGGRSFTLTPGLATVELGGREAQARADRVILTDDPTFTPTEMPVDDQTPPGPVTGATATGASGQVTLGWTNPGSSDFTRTIVRVRTDGRFPVSPVDGFPVTIENAAPGSSDGFVHTGLTNGTTYSYALFAQDASGNTSQAATVQETVGDGTPPANVNNLRRSDRR